ncbi:hypothetical protein BJY00DRAFT_17193 [Aspergillus carlsbadensis]|nr:hypothetical protein BJY00DRAFT_17193 [Aspergillus carlsbadensis]
MIDRAKSELQNTAHRVNHAAETYIVQSQHYSFPEDGGRCSRNCIGYLYIVRSGTSRVSPSPTHELLRVILLRIHDPCRCSVSKPHDIRHATTLVQPWVDTVTLVRRQLQNLTYNVVETDETSDSGSKVDLHSQAPCAPPLPLGDTMEREHRSFASIAKCASGGGLASPLPVTPWRPFV